MARREGAALTRRQALQAAAMVGGGVAVGSALGGVRGVAAQGTPAMFPQVQATLTRLAEDVWVWTNGGYNSLIISSDAGTLVTEPSSQFNRQASSLLKAVAASVSGGQPVKYVVFSHGDPDHNTGGDVFADTAEFVAQERAAPQIAARNDPRSPVPTITFAERMTLDLGGKAIELHYLGRNHSDNSLVLEYPARRLIHAVDWMENRRLPFRDLQASYLDEWLAGLDRIIDEFDFDILVPGHTPPGSKGTVVDVRQYWFDLFGAIRDAQAMGLPDNSPEMVELVRTRLAPTYGSWNSFADFLPLNIQGVLRIGIPNR